MSIFTILSYCIFPVFLILLTLGYFLNTKVNKLSTDTLSGPFGTLTNKIGLKLATLVFYVFDLAVSVILFLLAYDQWWYAVLVGAESLIYAFVSYKAYKKLKELSSVVTS